MSYSNPRSIKYAHFFDFGGAADETLTYIGPKGAAGRLWNYGVEGIIEAMSGSTVTPKIAIGTTSDPDAYGDELVLHGLAADSVAGDIRALYEEDDTDTTGWLAYMLNRELPVDTAFRMTLTGATGTPTGQGTAFCIVDWAD